MEAVERYEMPQPIPPYLLAFAVGSLAAQGAGAALARVGRARAAGGAPPREFEDVDAMLRAAESLFGPYDWERFDLLTMPPSFPYGGMENPRLTFLTPTLLAGDKSLVNVVAHELAHSWTGNLVTNASAEHFWLNEGFTVFAERRILEALEGTEVAALHAALGRRSLETALEHFSDAPAAHRAAHAPDGRGSGRGLLAGALREGLPAPARAGGRGGARGVRCASCGATSTRSASRRSPRRTSWPSWSSELPGALAKVNADAYLHQPGHSAPARPSPRSERLEEDAAAQGQGALAGGGEGLDARRSGSSSSSGCRADARATTFRALDERFQLTKSTNSEVLVSWLVAALRAELRARAGAHGDVPGRGGAHEVPQAALQRAATPPGSTGARRRRSSRSTPTATTPSRSRASRASSAARERSFRLGAVPALGGEASRAPECCENGSKAADSALPYRPPQP